MGSSPNGNDLSAMNNLNAINPSAAPNPPETHKGANNNVYDAYGQNDTIGSQAAMHGNDSVANANSQINQGHELNTQAITSEQMAQRHLVPKHQPMLCL